MFNKTPFDAIAGTYDSDFTNSTIGKLQRNKVHAFVTAQLAEKKSLHILEINCGTGEDAIWLAKQGNTVIATDISNEMIAIAKQKQALLSTPYHLTFEVCGFTELNNKYNNQQFDLIFSNFAGLNCVDGHALSDLNKQFAKLLKPKGELIAVILGKYCLLERLYFMLSFNFKKMNRRKKQASAYLSDNNYQNTWCYSYQEIASIFTQFTLKEQKPIGLFIPPSYIENKIKRNTLLLNVLLLLERVLGNISLFANYGDHVIIQMKKKQ